MGLFLSAQFAFAYHNSVHAVEPQFSISKTQDETDHQKIKHDDCNICAVGKIAHHGGLLAAITLHLPTLLALSILAPHEALHNLTLHKAYNAQAPPVLS